MSGLDSIPVHIDGADGKALRTENLQPLLQQVGQALRDLCDGGPDTTIDLSAMPFSSQDETDLRAALGEGEVSATLNAFGPTRVEETAVPGVWIVEHKDVNDHRLALHLEITRVPAILVTPEADIADGVAALDGLTAKTGASGDV